MNHDAARQQAIEVMRAERSTHRRVLRGSACTCGWSAPGRHEQWTVDYERHVEGAVLDALRVAPQDEACGTCEGTGVVPAWTVTDDDGTTRRSDDDDDCRDCDHGCVSGGPLMILGPEEVPKEAWNDGWGGARYVSDGRYLRAFQWTTEGDMTTTMPKMYCVRAPQEGEGS